MLFVQDKKDIEFACRAGVDWIAMSFVQTSDDMTELRQRVLNLGFREMLILHLEPPRCFSIMAELYCIFNEGYLKSSKR